MDLHTYRNKVKGCWVGKNIGGVFGAPFEGKRQVNTADFYTQDLSASPPSNDDLDLQIVWLAAVEQFGRRVNSSILGEYWLSFIMPNWVEYGTGKANLRAGLAPPLSGVVDNVYRNSCGCFIRSEIWACLAPGHPEIASRYAYEDAVVDHAEEGIFGEIFCAALQSAAFVENNPEKLIEAALSYIPHDCSVARAVRMAQNCHTEGIVITQARKLIHNTAPGTFGLQASCLEDIQKEEQEGMLLGTPGFDAPENVAFMVAGWLYGEGDFEKSLIAANSFGEDTDCTCATLGALLGILSGEDGLPFKWTAPLDDLISTSCIDNTSLGIWIPHTASELTDRVLNNTPAFLGPDLCKISAESGFTISCLQGEELFCPKQEACFEHLTTQGNNSALTTRQLCSLSSYITKHDSPAMQIFIDYNGSVYYKKDVPRKVSVRIYNALYLKQQQWVKIKVFMPAGVEMLSSDSVLLQLNHLNGDYAETTFEFIAGNVPEPRLEFIVSCTLEGRHSNENIKVTMLRQNESP